MCCYILPVIILYSHEKYNSVLLYTNILENEAKRDFFTDFAFHSTNISQPSDEETVELVSP